MKILIDAAKKLLSDAKLVHATIIDLQDHEPFGQPYNICFTLRQLAQFAAMQQPKWIDCSVELPKVSATAKDFQLLSGESDRVLVLINSYELIATYHSKIDNWSIPFHSGNWRPTHWMPLLEHPADLKDKQHENVEILE